MKINIRQFLFAAFLCCIVPVRCLMAQCTNQNLVSADQCKPTCCMCSDTTQIKNFMENQRLVQASYNDVLSGGGLHTDVTGELAAAMAQRYNAATTTADVRTAGGLSTTCGGGQMACTPHLVQAPIIDKCVCQNACEMIPSSLNEHEKKHAKNHKTLLAKINYLTGFGLPIAGGFAMSQFLFGSYLLADEISAYTVELDFLKDRLNTLQQHCTSCLPPSCVDPSCKTGGLAKKGAWSTTPPPRSATSLADRFSLLVSRIVHGAR